MIVLVTGGALLFADRGPSGEVVVAREYAAAFARQDPKALYALLDDGARGRVTEDRFAELHRDAMKTATATRIVPGPVVKVDDTHVDVPMTIRTRIFGTVRATLALAFSGDGDPPGVDWRRKDVFPGLLAGEELTADEELPPRGTILARDNQVLAQGEGRTPDPAVADVARETVGRTGPVPANRQEALAARGVPTDATVGLSGLERALDDRLIGTPGGTLKAGPRILARTEPKQATAVRSTVSPSLERTAVAALAGRLGGVVALDPKTGELLAYAGIAFSGLQPPGSTFKMITATAALEAGITSPKATFPVRSSATLSGVTLQNADGELCGGTLAHSFAESCNSVFAPLGAQLGAKRLVKTAEEFGFNRPPDIPGAATSTIPQDIGDDLAVGSTSIGQGRVLASALQMATVAATISLGGRRPRLTLDYSERVDNTKLKPVVDPSAARAVGRFMLDVVSSGTGRAAALPGVQVAGKTGTAELSQTQGCAPGSPACDSADDGSDTDAWFAAFAPGAIKRTPKVAVGVLLVRNGAGGDTAAPVAREIIKAAL